VAVPARSERAISSAELSKPAAFSLCLGIDLYAPGLVVSRVPHRLSHYPKKKIYADVTSV
jgi:hypothetical protein